MQIIKTWSILGDPGGGQWGREKTMDISLKLVCVATIFFFFLLSPYFDFLDSARAETIATQATLKRALSAYPKERTDFTEKYDND